MNVAPQLGRISIDNNVTERDIRLFAELPKRSPSDDMSDLMPWCVELSDV
ncbi:hypothetical protein [Salinivibrio socompensis]|nr:hypothetical protein [Salinivibrio socompensis]